MSKCLHCQQRKGKRRCPALSGVICSACCGQHRGREIQCPLTCQFFTEADGSESLAAADNPAAGKMIAAMFGDEDWCDQAEAAFLGTAEDRPIEKFEEPNLIGYMAYGYTDQNGQRYVDHYLHRHGARLKLAETKALTALRDAWFSAFEVQEIQTDVGLQLLDLITEESIFVHEKLGTHDLVKFEVILAWVVSIGGRFILTGGGSKVPRMHKDAVLKAMRAALTRAKKDRPDAPVRTLMPDTAGPAHRAMARAFKNQVPPKLVTMDGEDICFSEAIFDITDAVAVKEKLGAHPDIDEGEDDYIWVDRKGRRQLGPGPLHLGTITVTEGRLKLETKSRERIERGKLFLLDLLGDLAKHRLDTYKDLDVALAEHAARGTSAAPENTIPPELQAALLSSFMQDRLMQWIDEEIPALDGKTPREAVRTKRGREQVVELLKDQEHTTQHMPGGDRVDFSVVYRELGLDPFRL
jgi:hypothetical protein